MVKSENIFSDISILTELADMTIAPLVTTFVDRENLSCEALLNDTISTIHKRVEFPRVICFC